jgi:hypothetical protein
VKPSFGSSLTYDGCLQRFNKALITRIFVVSIKGADYVAVQFLCVSQLVLTARLVLACYMLLQCAMDLVAQQVYSAAPLLPGILLAQERRLSPTKCCRYVPRNATSHAKDDERLHGTVIILTACCAPLVRGPQQQLCTTEVKRCFATCLHAVLVAIETHAGPCHGDPLI